MTRSKKLRVLREIYAELPTDVGCKGLCANAWSFVPIFPFELEILEDAARRPLATEPLHKGRALGLGELGQPCPLLVMGRCSAYEVRPIICRVYGAAEGIRCPHGCTPATLLTDAEVYRKFERVEAL